MRERGSGGERMRTARRLCLAVGLLALAWGLTPPLHAQPVPRTLKIAVGIEADTLDPAAQTTGLVMNMVDYMYERLVALDYKQNKVVPRLATRWQASTDGLTYTFGLRGGVTFHDGTPFNAEAVKFTLCASRNERTTSLLIAKLTF